MRAAVTGMVVRQWDILRDPHPLVHQPLMPSPIGGMSTAEGVREQITSIAPSISAKYRSGSTLGFLGRNKQATLPPFLETVDIFIGISCVKYIAAIVRVCSRLNGRAKGDLVTE